jgi:hypothetical protein
MAENFINRMLNDLKTELLDEFANIYVITGGEIRLVK